jgi:UrcA family protein
MRKSVLSASALILSGLFMASSSVSFAQNSEEITVVGKAPDSVRSLSQAVSYADLDLSAKAGRDELRHRLSLTARFLCEKLGEADSGSPVVPSCRDAALKDATARAGTIEEGFAPRGTTWVAGNPWQPPYPADWSKRYP